MPTLAFPFRPATANRPILVRAAPGVIGFGFFSALLFLIVFVDALINSRASYDLRALQAVQDINAPWRDTILPRIEHLTDSNGAVLAWIVVLSGFITMRRWSWASIVALVPIGGVINLALSSVVTRARPHLDELLRSSLNPEERSFPSGHVIGAVMLYGIVFVAVRELRVPVLRYATRAACVAIVVIAGYQRLWVGAHWPSDVIGGYALGGLLLACLLVCRECLSPDITSPVLQSVKATLRTTIATFRASHGSE